MSSFKYVVGYDQPFGGVDVARPEMVKWFGEAFVIEMEARAKDNVHGRAVHGNSEEGVGEATILVTHDNFAIVKIDPAIRRRASVAHMSPACRFMLRSNQWRAMGMDALKKNNLEAATTRFRISYEYHALAVKAILAMGA